MYIFTINVIKAYRLWEMGTKRLEHTGAFFPIYLPKCPVLTYLNPFRTFSAMRNPANVCSCALSIS